MKVRIIDANDERLLIEMPRGMFDENFSKAVERHFRPFGWTMTCSRSWKRTRELTFEPTCAVLEQRRAEIGQANVRFCNELRDIEERLQRCEDPNVPIDSNIEIEDFILAKDRC